MLIEHFNIRDILLIRAKRILDSRGWFSEVFREDKFALEAGNIVFVQHNQSYSAQKGTVRGLHFQLEPKAQGKLVRCARGRVLDIAVDLRVSSPTYAQHIAVELSAEDGSQLWIPPGFAHGFCTLEDHCELNYLVTDYYSQEHDRGILWRDPSLAIPWPVGYADAILSPKDKVQPLLTELPTLFP